MLNLRFKHPNNYFPFTHKKLPHLGLLKDLMQSAIVDK